MRWLKKNWIAIVLGICALGLSLWQSTSFWIVVFLYVLAINFILKGSISKKVIGIISTTIWVVFVLTIGLTAYVNYYLPHGPSYSTGEYVCQNDDRGPCAEEYKEDLRDVNIPIWAKFLRTSGGQLTWMALLFAGIVIKSRKEEG